MSATDYLAIADDGTVVRGPGVESGGDAFVQFGADLAIGVPSHVRNLVVRRDGRACAFKGQNGTCYLVSRSGHVEPQGPVYGDEAVAFTPDGRLVFITSVATVVVNGVPRDLPARRHGTSQGLVSVGDDLSMRFVDDCFETPKAQRTFAGIEFVKWRSVGVWTVGLSQVGVACVNVETQQAWTFPQANATNWIPKAIVLNGTLMIATSQPGLVLTVANGVPYTPPVVVPVPPPVPVPPVEVPPVPTMPDSLFDDLVAERAKYPAHLARPEDAAAILNAVAWKHRDKGWGLSAKPRGNAVHSIGHNQPVAYDILHNKPSDTLWDVATGEWELMQVQWAHQPIHHHDPERPWLAPVPPTGVVTPPTPEPPIVAPPQTPELVDLAPIVARLEAIEGALGDAVESLHEIEIALSHLRAAEPPVYKAQVKAGWPVGTMTIRMEPEP